MRGDSELNLALDAVLGDKAFAAAALLGKRLGGGWFLIWAGCIPGRRAPMSLDIKRQPRSGGRRVSPMEKKFRRVLLEAGATQKQMQEVCVILRGATVYIPVRGMSERVATVRKPRTVEKK